MLYIFAGFPKCGLNAGGMRHLIEVEELGLLEEDPGVSYSNDGEHEYRMSDLCERDGITWRWFTEDWTFGNGVTVHKTTAEYQKHIVILNDNSLAVTVDDRSAYEARWAPGTCPQESHVVHLTWLVFQHALPDFAYGQLQSLIEGDAPLIDPELYEYRAEPGKYQSATRPLIFGKERHAVPCL